MPGVGEALDEALLETHHLANLSGLDEAQQARRRLVEAQSASSVERTRDRLEQAIEYLELARMERRDTAAGFVQARELVAYAEAGLTRERPVPMTGSPVELVRSAPERERRKNLQELRAEAAVSSYQQLRYDVRLEDTFRTLHREVNEGEIEHVPADDPELDPEAALELASLEMDIERSLQGTDEDRAESEFEFVEDDELASADGGTSPADGDPGRGEADDGSAPVVEVGDEHDVADGDGVGGADGGGVAGVDGDDGGGTDGGESPEGGGSPDGEGDSVADPREP